MRKMIMGIAIAFSLVTVGLIIVLVLAINGNVHMVTANSDKAKLVNTQSAVMDGIDDVKVEFYSDDVVFYKSKTNELVVKEYKTYTPEKDEMAEVIAKGDQLLIRGEDNHINFSIFSHINHYSRIEIYLPENYSGALSASTTSGDISSDLVLQLSKFDTSSNSGDVELNEITADEINLSSSSGEISIRKAEGKRKISTTSGDVYVYNGNGDTEISTSSGEIAVEKSSGKLQADTNSGDINIQDSNGDKNLESTSGEIYVENSTGLIEAKSSSGDINVNHSRGAGNISTTSGEISLELMEVTDNIRLNASSGGIELTIPEATAFQFTADTSSGDIGTYFDDKLSFDNNRKHASGTIGENPQLEIELSTTSGEIGVGRN